MSSPQRSPPWAPAHFAAYSLLHFLFLIFKEFWNYIFYYFVFLSPPTSPLKTAMFIITTAHGDLDSVEWALSTCLAPVSINLWIRVFTRLSYPLPSPSLLHSPPCCFQPHNLTAVTLARVIDDLQLASSLVVALWFLGLSAAPTLSWFFSSLFPLFCDIPPIPLSIHHSRLSACSEPSYLILGISICNIQTPVRNLHLGFLQLPQPKQNPSSALNWFFWKTDS